MPQSGTYIRVENLSYATYLFGTLAAIKPAGSGHLAVVDCDAPASGTSNLNVAAGRNIANGVGVPVPKRVFCIKVAAPTHVLWDNTFATYSESLGPYTDARGQSLTMAPLRTLDTRTMAWNKPAVQRFGVDIPWKIDPGVWGTTKSGGVLRVHLAPVPGATYALAWDDDVPTSSETEEAKSEPKSNILYPPATCGAKASEDYVPQSTTIGYAREPMLPTDLCHDIATKPATVGQIRKSITVTVSYPGTVDGKPGTVTSKAAALSPCPSGAFIVARGSREKWTYDDPPHEYTRADGSKRAVADGYSWLSGMGRRGTRVYASTLDISGDLARINPWAFRPVAVRYPALLPVNDTYDETYVGSRKEGIQYVHTLLDQAWAPACRSAITLFGYSQGADVVAQVFSDRIGLRAAHPDKEDRGLDLISQVSLFSDAGNDITQYNLNSAESKELANGRRVPTRQVSVRRPPAPLPPYVIQGSGSAWALSIANGSTRVAPNGRNVDYDHYCWVGDIVCSPFFNPPGLGKAEHGDQYDAYEPVAANTIRRNAVTQLFHQSGAPPTSTLGTTQAKEKAYLDWNAEGAPPLHADNAVYALPVNLPEIYPYAPDGGAPAIP